MKTENTLTVRDLKPGTWFTLKPIDCPKEGQVWVRGEYDRTEKKYCCQNWADICRERSLKGSTPVYTDFIF